MLEGTRSPPGEFRNFSEKRSRASGEVPDRRGRIGLSRSDEGSRDMMVLSHPTGNEFVRQALTAFNEAGMLGEFWTTLSWNPDSFVNQLLPVSLRELLRRRSYP